MDDPRPAPPSQTRRAFAIRPAGWALLAVLAFLGFEAATDRGSSPPAQGPLARDVAPRGELAPAEEATIRLFEENAPSVAHVTTIDVLRRRNIFAYDLLEVPRGTGSGFLWDENGYLVTNYHVAGDIGATGSTRLVRLADGEEYEAEYIGGDPENDIAVLRIDASGADAPLRPLALGTSSDLKVGQSVFAIGSPFGLDWTLTTGVISGLDRTITSLASNRITGVIQTDASINPGNSGGPLLDSSGRLIGMNTAILSTSGSSAGLGFAVPVDTIRRIVPEVVRGGLPRAGLGVVTASDRTAQNLGIEGAIVVEVLPGSAAERAGLRSPAQSRRGLELDVIVAVDGDRVDSGEALRRLLARREPGDRVTLEVVRSGGQVELEAELQRLDG